MKVLALTERELLNFFINDIGTTAYIHYDFNEVDFYEVANKNNSYIVFVCQQGQIGKQLKTIKSFLEKGQRNLERVILFSKSEILNNELKDKIILSNKISQFNTDIIFSCDNSKISSILDKNEVIYEYSNCISKKRPGINSDIINNLNTFRLQGYNALNVNAIEVIQSCEKLSIGFNFIQYTTDFIDLNHNANEINWKSRKRKLVKSRYIVLLLDEILKREE